MRQKPLISNPTLKRIDVGNIDLLAHKSGKSSAILYFHGFPGPFEVLEGNNLRAADFVFDVIREEYDFYYPLYTMSKTKPFSFTQSMQDAVSAFEYVKRGNYDSVTLVGQSWGTVLSMPLIELFDFSKIILVTPFLKVPADEEGEALVRKFSAQHPQLLSPQHLTTLCEEFNIIAKEKQPLGFLKDVSDKTTLIVSEHDEIVPLAMVKALGHHFPKLKIEILANQPHVIENKENFAQLFYEKINA